MLSLQLRMLYNLAVIGIIYVTATSSLALTARDTGRDTALRERSRCPFIRNSLVNGRVKIRSRGRIAKFICNNGYELVGRRFATCVRSQWNNPIPICVTNGCPVINNPVNGEINIQINDALVSFSCDAGYTLRGSSTVYCNGVFWNDTVPVCDIATLFPEFTCDFEDPNLCGWSHDRYHDFDWRRHQFNTPSGHAGTGPSYDHTLGRNNDGHYMYTEASPPRVINDSARLFSPVYFPETTPACFVFWYHMFGATTGALRVFLKKESQVFKELLPMWERTGPQGNLWLQGDLSIPELKESFQIVIEGIRGSGYIGDTAIDDVALYSTPCEDLVVANITRGADSCKQRCFSDEDENSTCSCKQGCDEIKTCCDDYEYFCTDSANMTDVGLFTTPPKRISTPSEQSHLPTETFQGVTVTPGSTFTSSGPTLLNTSEVVISTSLNISSNTSDQTIMPKSPSLTVLSTISVLTNETIPVLTSPKQNLSPSLTTVSSATSVNISIGTIKPVSNTTTSQTVIFPTMAIIDKITQKEPPISYTSSATTKQIFIPLTSVKASTTPTTTPQTAKSITLSSKPTTVQKFKTTNIASTLNLPKKTTSTTALTSSTSSTSTTASTAAQSTPKLVIPPTSTTPAPTTKAPLESQFTVSIRSATYSTPRNSFYQERKSNSVSTTESSSAASVKTSSSIIDKLLSTVKYSNVYTTNKKPTSTTPMTTKSSTFVYYRKTEKPAEKPSSVITSISQTARPTTTATTSSKFEAKTSFKYPKQSHSLIPQETKSSTPKFLITASSISSVSSSTSTLRKLTSAYCPEGSLRFRNGRCFPPWTHKIFSSKADVTTRTTNFLKTSSVITKSSSTPSEVTELSNTKMPRKTQNVTINQQTLPTSSKSATGNPIPTTIAYESTEMLSIWKPNFKARTKYRTYLQKPSEKSPVSIAMIIALTVGLISMLILIIIVAIYILCRKRKVAQSKLSDDSEMRFLSDSEIIEFADASTKLHTDSS